MHEMQGRWVFFEELSVVSGCVDGVAAAAATSWLPLVGQPVQVF